MFLETKKEGEARTEEKPSLAGFVAWLECQPANAPYDVYNPNICAYAQYSGRCVPNVSDIGVELGVSYCTVARIVGDHPHTFGGALERARMALSKA